MEDAHAGDAEHSAFEDIIAANWAEPDPSTTAEVQGGGFKRRMDGSWVDGDTGLPLDPGRAAELERLWREWAPRLPDEVRRAIEGDRGDGGDPAGDREPRDPEPSPSTLTEALDGPDGPEP